jgi:hypothetical protein
MAARPLRLYTLDYVVPPEEMGDVHIYPLTPAFAALWEDLARQWDRRQGFKTPHGSLSVALSTVTGRMVIFTIRDDEVAGAPLSRRSLIVSDGPLDTDLTRVCFDAWQTRHFGDRVTGDRLSQFIDFGNVAVRPLHEVLERDDAGYITGPWWWKKAVGWGIVQKLRAHALVDKTRPRNKIEFVVSTGGTLVAWNYPWIRVTNRGNANQRVGYAMGYVSVRGETRRASKDPVVRIDCHVTRVARVWNNVKTVHVKHPQFPTLLHVPVRSLPARDRDGKEIKAVDGSLTWQTTFRGHTADIVQACGLDPIAIPEQADGDLSRIRPVFRNKGKHMIGKGPGAYFTLRMATHIRRVLGRHPAIYEATRYNIPGKSITSGPIPAAKLPAALASSGWKSLCLVVLFEDDSTPRRVLHVLRADYGIPIPADLGRDDAVYDSASLELVPGVTIVMCKAPEIIMHGAHDRAGIIQQVPCLKPAGPDDLIAAICETKWSGIRIINDGKHPTRRALAGQRIVSQFLVAKEHSEEADSVDHPASAAIRDILKSCGIVDNRLAYAVGATPEVPKEAPLTEPVTLIGIHLRRHVYKKFKGRSRKPPKLVAVLTAIHLDADPQSTPRIEMYANGMWLRYAEGVTAFHANELGNEHWGRDGVGAHAVRNHIEEAMDSLILPEGSHRVVIVLDKEEAQTIYAGAGDNPGVTGPLPGRRLAQDGLDVAVVRVALGPHAPRPATAFREGDDLEEMKPSYHKRILFVNNDGEEPSWLLTQDSHQHQGAKSPQRIGTQMSREDFGEIAASRMSKDMHATSRVEIVVPMAGGSEPGHLAVLAARLCDQAVAWDNRTARPSPLHLGYTADRDHPDYGDHDPGGEADDDELEIDED